VGLQIEDLASEHAAEPAEPCDNLVRDEEDAVAAKNWYNSLKITSWWRNDTAHAHHRLGDECRNCLRSFLHNQGFQIFRKTCRKFGLAFTGPGGFPIARTIGVQKARQGQTKICMEAR